MDRYRECFSLLGYRKRLSICAYFRTEKISQMLIHCSYNYHFERVVTSGSVSNTLRSAHKNPTLVTPHQPFPWKVIVQRNSGEHFLPAQTVIGVIKTKKYSFTHLHVTHSAKNLNTLISNEPSRFLKILKYNRFRSLCNSSLGCTLILIYQKYKLTIYRINKIVVSVQSEATMYIDVILIVGFRRSNFIAKWSLSLNR